MPPGQPAPPTVNPSLTLLARHDPPLRDIPIPPGLQPISLPEYVCLDSVRAALGMFDIKVPVNDIISAIREEEESKLVVPESRHTICKLTLQLHQSADPQFIPKAIPNLRPKYIELERRRRLCSLAKEAAIFPNG